MQSEEPARNQVTEGPEIEKSQEAPTGGFDFGDRGEDESRLDELGDFEMPPLPPVASGARRRDRRSDDDLLDLDDLFDRRHCGSGVRGRLTRRGGRADAAWTVTSRVSGGFTLGTEDK